MAAGTAAGAAEEVLHHPQRADDRAVYAAEEQREKQQRRDDADVQRQQGGHQLHAGQIAEPRMRRPREVEEEERNADEAERGQHDSDFP